MNEAESAGEHLSDGQLKPIIFAKMPADTSASLRQQQSDEKVKSWWTEVTGFPGSMGRFRVRDAPKKWSPSIVSKSNQEDGVRRLGFAEKEDRDILNKLVNQGFPFVGTRLVAKPWVFSFTPLNWGMSWRELVDANHKQFHEGLSGNPPLKVGMRRM